MERVIVVHPDFPDLTLAAPSAPEKEQGACRSSIRATSELGADQACPDRMSKLSSKEDIADMVPEGREKSGVCVGSKCLYCFDMMAATLPYIYT